MLACQVAHADVGKQIGKWNLKQWARTKETPPFPVLSSSFFIHLNATQESLDDLLINSEWVPF